MITRILNSKLPLMIYTPVKVFDIRYFHSVYASGALPVFDTEFLSRDDILHKVLLLSKETFCFGVRLSRWDETLIAAIKNKNLNNLDLMVVPFSKQAQAEDMAQAFSNFGDTRLILEIKDIDLTDEILKADPSGLILKGNEAAGNVSRYSSFILMQWYLKQMSLPVFIHGGVGKYTGAGMLAAGVSGFVMDSQVLLSDQAPVSENFKALLESLDEGDSTEISFEDQERFRVFAKLGTKIVKDLKQEAVLLAENPDGLSGLYDLLSEKMTALDDPDAAFIQSLFYLGQDAVFAKDFARESKDLSQMIHSFFTTIGDNLNFIDQFDPIVPDSNFAADQNTRLPLIQGPMANITDNAQFASKVLEQGALPFFAVGSLPKDLADDMLKKGAQTLDNFGAGLVGIEAFNPQVNIHLDMVKQYKVPYALFAGGVPSQVLELEKAGTKTYLHTPSVSMMANALENGCRRFIFEGAEAGGHVGSLSSMVLWEAAISRLVNSERNLSDIYLVFAGGISTCFASFFISGLTAFLAAKGAKIGIQAGTAYLFTKEIVDTKSIQKLYQDIVIEKNETVVIGKTLGLASRTAPTGFAKMMMEHEAAMIREKKPLDQRKKSFEKRNIGSLLIGAKGFLPDFKNPGEEHYTWYEGPEHREKGNFLVGDSLAFFKDVTAIKDIHTMMFQFKHRLRENLNQLEVFSSPRNRINDEIAVVGVGCTLPGAQTPDQLWDNILNKTYAIKEMPESRFNADLYLSGDKSAEDRTYTRLAGIIEDFQFDAKRFGYDEDKENKLSRSQKMVLQTAYKAVESAGLLNENDQLSCDDPSRTSVIIATCLSNELGNDLQLKYWYPQLVSMLEKTEAYQALDPEEKEKINQALLDGIEGENKGYDPVHGMLLNIEASRIARHLGIRGVNYIVDAACASSITALDAAAGELLSGEVDQVIVGGVNTHLAPESFIGFAKMGTLSATGSHPFDQRADGFVLGEGSVVFVLKRMKDALRDNNQIFGIINGIGSSSDGKGKAIAAPNPKGQLLSIQRCYENTRKGFHPDQIEFIEAHGTATIIGDQAELETLTAGYTGARAGVSSIKSQIGHLLGCAGSAGLLKALLAVQKGVLPPNGNFETLSSSHDLSGSSLYIVKDQQPWEPRDGQSRKAAVSSYGFGGINYHVALEEMTPSYVPVPRDFFRDLSYDFNDDRIVVAGLGVFLPGAKNSEEFWEKLVSGEKQLSQIPGEHFDNDAYSRLDKKSHYHLPHLKAGIVKDFQFNNLKYRMPPTMVKSVERGQLFGLTAASEALESSGLLKQEQAAARTGVILGTIPGERQSKNILRVRKLMLANIIKQTADVDDAVLDKVAGQLVDVIRSTIPENNEDTTPGLLSNIISGRITNYFGLNGANYVVDASCASAVIAIRNAARDLKQKNMDFCLAGGVDCNLYPAVLMAFKRLGLLSSGDCNFFDDRADGYVMGEGAAIHVLTTYKKATESGMKILGEINECAVKSSVPDHLLAPSEHTFVSAINQAYRRSGIRKSEVDHLDLFAFSNIFGDMIEKQVTQACFSHPMHCGNVKPQFGYFKAANPAVAMAKLMLMNAKGKILPDFNFEREHSIIKECAILKPALELTNARPGRPLRFASNVNGIGGNHAHLIMGALPARLVPEQHKVDNVVDVSFTAVPEDDRVLSDTAWSAGPGGKKQRIVALLSGQGAQHPGMMKTLFESDAHIREVMEKGEAIFKEQRGYSLLDLMFGEDESLNSTQNTQAAVFLSSAAVCSRLALEGFSPDYFIGHSVGEYTALFCSGILGFEDAMRLVIKRSDLMHESTLKVPGKIMVVFENEKKTEKLIRKSFVSDIYITNKNSEKQTAVSGKAQSIEKFCDFLKEEKVMFKKLNLTGAFHTPLLADASEKLRQYLDTLTFKRAGYGRIISNTLAAPYPKQVTEIKDLLARQIVSPVEFIKSIEHVYASGKTHFIEIGPSRLLVNLLKYINIGEYGTTVSVDPKKGEVESFEACRQYLISLNALFKSRPVREIPDRPGVDPFPDEPEQANVSNELSFADMAGADISEDFESFKQDNQSLIDKILYKEFQRKKRDAAIDAIKRYDFNTRRILISGVSVGLPGKARHVFAKDNFDAILNGKNFIESLSQEDQARITDKNITKLFKEPDGNARFVQITKTEDVIHLAGQLGYFNLTDEYGIKEEYDIAMSLGIAAGIEALKDANIPLVMQYKKMKDGKALIPDGFALPEEMQEETGVIITSLWPNGETLMAELEKYFYEKLFLKPYEEFEKIYYFLMEKVNDLNVKEEITEWFFKAKARKRTDFTTYKFDRNFLANACPLGSAHLAQIIKAKGPNTLVSSACASTTLAMGIAEDWIRVGRCKRVLVVGGENATSPRQAQWVGSGFLALGAATIKKRVSEAAKPFDEDRNGTILGAGAVGLVIEDEKCAAKRGMNGQCQILGTHIANSAYHTYNIDVPHMAREMNKFIAKVEKQNNLTKTDYADKLLFMSHETYTPARGGSADAEVTALESAFADHLDTICISNTKGFTGHTLGAAIEDVVLVKALQKRKAPPIANLQKVPDRFRNLNFSGREKINAEYGLHLSAGFGSHFAFMFVKRVEENPVEGNLIYQNWLKQITGSTHPELKVIDNTLCVVAGDDSVPVEEPDIQTVEPATASIEPVTGPDPVERIREIIARQTGYAADMLEGDLDLEADLGIDTVKQVEIFGTIASGFGFDVPDDLKLRDLNTIDKLAAYVSQKVGPAMAAPSEKREPESFETRDTQAPQTLESPMETVKAVIAEQTGYTVDMLEPDLDLEADLGIDTVKQVEIFGKVATRFGFDVPDDLKLRDLNTIARLSDYIVSRTGGGTAATKPEPQENPVASEPIPQTSGPVPGNDPVDTVKEIIAAQTGYAVDMLEPGLDLEADLGIDTVKQVEIFGKVATHFGFDVPDDLKLRELNTIARLSAYIESRATEPDHSGKEPIPVTGSGPSPAPSANEKTAKTDTLPDPASPIKRLVVRVNEAALPELSSRNFKKKKILISLDHHGMAQVVAEQVKRLGGEVITLGDPDLNPDVTLPFADLGAAALVGKELASGHPDLDGFIHLAPLDFYIDRETHEFASDPELNTTIKSTFVLIQALYEVLDKPGTLIATMAFDSVIFPYMKECNDIYPMFAGLSGLLKTVNKEMAHTRVKVVDFSYPHPLKSKTEISDLFINELLSDDPRCEAGYKDLQRYVLSMKTSAPDQTERIINDNDTLLVTGGAGGITYEIIKQVVQEYKVNLVILDINDIYATDPKFLDKQATSAELMAMLREDMPKSKPVEIKRALDRLNRVRTAVDNMEYLRSQGISVEYICTDVTDYEAVKKAVDACPEIDGIFHAAGMEMSQFIPKKELWSFELVTDVKIKGMRNLLKAAQEKDYKYFLTFSSVTARFGNQGQADYTAANDFLGKTLLRQKQLHPQRAYKVYAWTAWDGVGMATNSTVKKVLEDRGIKFLPMDQGVKFFMADLLDRTESEMVFSGLDYEFDIDGLLGDPGGFPFLDDPIKDTPDSKAWARTLDLNRDIFLEDHTMGDVPLFLGSTGVETMAEAARNLTGGREHLTRLKDFHIPYGIKLLKGRPKELMIQADLKDDQAVACRIESVFKNPKGQVMGDPKLHYQGVFEFSETRPDSKTIEIGPFSPLSWEGDLDSLVYHPNRLFMFGLFATITDINSFDGTTLVTTVEDSSEAEFFKGEKNPKFQASPVLVDAMFQTGGLLEFLTSSRTVLPFKIEEMNFYRVPEKNTPYYCITRKIDSGEETNTYNLTLADSAGKVCIEINEFQMVKLARLDKEHRIDHKVTWEAQPA